MKRIKIASLISSLGIMLMVLFMSTACINNQSSKPGTGENREIKDNADTNHNLQKATFALGCFWHSEEMFSELKGVKEALPGYAGGKTKNPTYDEVSSGTTGYAESVDITFDPKIISYQKLVEVFFTEHDPTTPNYAAPDEGPQYRSVLFYRSENQKNTAEQYIKYLVSLKKYNNPIITQVVPFSGFYKAEDYHIHYYRNHPDQGYIASVTRPEIEKFRKDFKDLLK